MAPHANHHIRTCAADDLPRILKIINEAAAAYRGVIPVDCWHEPYMTAEQLERDITLGVSFIGMEYDRALVGVMGVQVVRDVELIRHAYVLPACQRDGVGGALIRYLIAHSTRRLLVGTWAAATWAIAFYQRHGFELVDATLTDALLRAYWDIPGRQRETSVVLERLPVGDSASKRSVTGSSSGRDA
jgi:GNAT superfamily N-acetyltransferase